MEKGDSTPGRRKGYSKWKDACCMSTECLKRALLICQGSMRTLVKVANSRRCVLGTAKDLRHGIFGFKNGPQRDFPGGKVVNNLPSNAGDSGSIPGWGTKIPHTTGKLSRRAATTRAHVPQLESPHTAREITHAATKACCNQTNESHIKGRLPGSSAGKESACIAGNPGSIPGSGRSPGEGRGYTLQYFGASLVAQMVTKPPAV